MRRLFLFLFVATLALIVALTAACGDDGGGSDEDAVRDAVRELTAVVNDRDFDFHRRLLEISTDDFETSTAFRIIVGDPGYRIVDLEIISVEVVGDSATVIATTIEERRGAHRDDLFFSRVDGRWLIDSIQ